jgi:hypothetical protein
MAKRSSKPNGSTTGSRVVKSRSSRRATTGAIEQRVVAAAEQIGRIVGTVQAKTEGWLGRTGSSAEKQARTSPRPPRSGGVVDAPGKQHRRPMPSQSGVKHSDARIAKMKASNRSRRRGGAR